MPTQTQARAAAIAEAFEQVLQAGLHPRNLTGGQALQWITRHLAPMAAGREYFNLCGPAGKPSSSQAADFAKAWTKAVQEAYGERE